MDGATEGQSRSLKDKIMAKYRKKPVVIEAEPWMELSDNPDVIQWNTVSPKTICKECGAYLGNHGKIKTLEGWHIVCPKDWIITGIKGEKYPCKPDIFEATYEKV